MKTAIEYNGDARRALCDVMRWLRNMGTTETCDGLGRCKMVIKEIRKGMYNKEYIHNLFSFAGIEGYPVDCMIDRYHPALSENKLEYYYFTFGCGQWMVKDGEEYDLRNHYTRISATDERKAREIMHSKRGMKWCTSYSKDFAKECIYKYDCIYIPWEQVTPQPGPTR